MLVAARQQPLSHPSLEQLVQVTRQHPRDRGDVDAEVHAGVGHGRARSSSRAGMMRCVSSSTSSGHALDGDRGPCCLSRVVAQIYAGEVARVRTTDAGRRHYPKPDTD